MTDKRKVICALLAGLLTFTLCACAQNTQDMQSGMYVRPSEFSEETAKVLELFDDELQFFDISLDETVKSFAISLWVYRDGEWEAGQSTYGGSEFLPGRIAIRLTETSFDLYTMDENGHTKLSCPVAETPFEESTGIGGARVDREIPIELHREIPLWVKIGTTENSMELMDITDDFRNAECNAGVAVTLTVSDEIVN